MNYELAKQLKDAGFPDMQYSIFVPLDCQEERNGKAIMKLKDKDAITRYHMPTLSELIGAVGDDFIELGQGSGRWVARGEDEPLEPMIFYGDTPEEAVAYLFLELNRDKKYNGPKNSYTK